MRARWTLVGWSRSTQASAARPDTFSSTEAMADVRLGTVTNADRRTSVSVPPIMSSASRWYRRARPTSSTSPLWVPMSRSTSMGLALTIECGAPLVAQRQWPMATTARSRGRTKLGSSYHSVVNGTPDLTIRQSSMLSRRYRLPRRAGAAGPSWRRPMSANPEASWPRSWAKCPSATNAELASAGSGASAQRTKPKIPHIYLLPFRGCSPITYANSSSLKCPNSRSSRATSSLGNVASSRSDVSTSEPCDTSICAPISLIRSKAASDTTTVFRTNGSSVERRLMTR